MKVFQVSIAALLAMYVAAPISYAQDREKKEDKREGKEDKREKKEDKREKTEDKRERKEDKRERTDDRRDRHDDRWDNKRGHSGNRSWYHGGYWVGHAHGANRSWHRVGGSSYIGVIPGLPIIAVPVPVGPVGPGHYQGSSWHYPGVSWGVHAVGYSYGQVHGGRQSWYGHSVQRSW